jgi:hypothetical protein
MPLEDYFDMDGMGDSDEDAGSVRCNRCGATDVYWMTVLGRREAKFHAKQSKNPTFLKLAKAQLFNTSGGKHVCPIQDNFQALDDDQ